MLHVPITMAQHGMACSLAAAGGDGLQIWKVAINILNKQLGQPGKGGPPA